MTKLKFLKEMHTVTKISEDSETAFYIYFLIYNKTKNKQLPNSIRIIISGKGRPEQFGFETSLRLKYPHNTNPPLVHAYA